MKPAPTAPPICRRHPGQAGRSGHPSRRGPSQECAAASPRAVVERSETSDLERLSHDLLERIAGHVDPLSWRRLRRTSTGLRDALRPEAYGSILLRQQGVGWDAEAAEDLPPPHELVGILSRRIDLEAALGRRQVRLVTSADVGARRGVTVPRDRIWPPSIGHTAGQGFWPGEALLPEDLRAAVGSPWRTDVSGLDGVSHIVRESGELQALGEGSARWTYSRVGDPGITTPFCLCGSHSYPDVDAFALHSWSVSGLAPRRAGQSVVTLDEDCRVSGWRVTPGGLDRAWGPIDIDPWRHFAALQRHGSRIEGIQRRFGTEWQSSRDGLWLLAVGDATTVDANRDVRAHAVLLGWAADAGVGPPCLVRPLGPNSGLTTAFFRDSRRLLSIGRRGREHCLRLSTLDANTCGEWQETSFGASARPIHAVDLAPDQVLVAAARHEQKGWLGGRGDDSLELWRLDLAPEPTLIWRMLDSDILAARFSPRGSCLLVMPRPDAAMVLLDLAPTEWDDASLRERPARAGRRLALPTADWSLRDFSGAA